jgi:hypothetical protein
MKGLHGFKRGDRFARAQELARWQNPRALDSVCIHKRSIFEPRQSAGGVGMKAKTRVLLLLFGLTLPYMIFVLVFALRFQQHPLPKWILYFAGCYFFGIIFLFPFLRRKVVAGAPPLSFDEKKAQNTLAVRSLRRLGYLFLLGPVFYFLDGGLTHNPWWATVLGLSWSVFLIWACFYQAKKIEIKVRQNAD